MQIFPVKLTDVCALEKDPGPCSGTVLRWFYDAKRQMCKQFVYGGCKGNANRFRSLAACEQRCSVKGTSKNSNQKRRTVKEKKRGTKFRAKKENEMLKNELLCFISE